MAGESFDYKVSIIGIGCIGSNLVPYLVRMGCDRLEVYDSDTVEEHNCRNQIYGPSDIGCRKTEALSKITKMMTGVSLVTHAKKVHDDYFDDVVICCVDSMEVRRQIWNRCIKFQPQVKFYIEARVGGPVLRVYSLDPSADLEGIVVYEDNLYDDPTMTDPRCARGEMPTLAAVVSVICELLRKVAAGDVLPHETIIDVSSWSILMQ